MAVRRLAGMIMWPSSKRAVEVRTAAAIAAVANDGGAVPVGVFVSENADAIAKACEAASLPVAQLHGDGARAAMLLLPSALQVSGGARHAVSIGPTCAFGNTILKPADGLALGAAVPPLFRSGSCQIYLMVCTRRSSTTLSARSVAFARLRVSTISMFPAASQAEQWWHENHLVAAEAHVALHHAKSLAVAGR